MKKYLLVFFPLVFLLISCKHENVKTENPKEKLQVVKKLCFISNIFQKEKNFASVDFIDLVKKNELGSEAASIQIIELPNDYCYLNKEKKFEDYEISDSVKIVMQKYSYDNEGNYYFGQSIKLTDLLKAVEKPKEARFLSSPYEIEILNNKIISLKEIYIP
jgi:hypothetical protein